MNDIQIKKNRTEGTAKATCFQMIGLELHELMADLFIYSNNPEEKKLIKIYENQLMNAWENPEKFEKELHLFFIETARYIKKKGLVSEFYGFCYFVFSTMSKKRDDKQQSVQMTKALIAYYNLLFQQMNYFIKHPNMVYGVTSKGEYLEQQEIYPNLDVAMMETAQKKSPDPKKAFYQALKKYGYTIQSELDFDWHLNNEQLLTNMILVMSTLIDEHTKMFKLTDYFPVTEGIHLPRPKTDTSYFYEALNKKRYAVPPTGVLGVISNCREIQQVFFMERFIYDRVILLYRVETPKGDFIGFFDTELELFYSPWKDTAETQSIHKRVENFVLELYSLFATDETPENARIVEKGKDVIMLSQPPIIVDWQIEEPIKSTDSSNKKKEKRFRTFSKKSYQPDTVHILPYIRRLPMGYQASQEAIELAQKYKYVLKENETFVKPFERTTYRKAKEKGTD